MRGIATLPQPLISEGLQGYYFRSCHRPDPASLRQIGRMVLCTGEGKPQLELPLAAILCPSTGWHESEKPLPPDCLRTARCSVRRTYVFAAQSAAVVNDTPSTLSPPLSVLWV